MSEEAEKNHESSGNPLKGDSLASSIEAPVAMGGMILSPGRVFGQYRVLSLLGRGGMGEVYEVEHCVLRRKYALKMLLADFVSFPDALDRFKSEARVMSNLEHPNIIRVDEFGEEGGRAWLRMELAAGLDIQGSTVHSLAQYVKAQGGHLGLAETRTIFTDILQGLAYSHSQEIVHRDLKPANILICPGANSKVNFKIADFGLVRMLGEEWVRTRAEQSFREAGSLSVLSTVRTDSSTGTSTHSLIGTYEYMSPEQKRCEDADKQSDVYAVGLMLYRLLTGRELVPRPPSHFARELSPAWDDFILKALEEKPEKRFADAAAMLKAFPSGLEGSSAPLRLKTIEVPPAEPATDSRLESVPEPEEPDILPPLPAKPHRFRMPGLLFAVLILGVFFFWRWQSGKAEEDHSPENSVESVQEEVAKAVETGLLDKGMGKAVVENVSIAEKSEPEPEPKPEPELELEPEPEPEPERAVRVPFGFQAPQNVLEPYTGSVWAKEAVHMASGIVMLYIPPGSFTMGSPVQEQADAINGGSKAEWVQIEKQHSVTLKYGFYMGACEITQEQWEKVMAENPAEFKNAGRNAPVERVSWEDCQRFCRRLGEGFRLPTEAEWEYACRAGTQSAVYSGKLTCAGVYNSPELDEIAWYGGNSKAEYEGAFDSSSWNEKQIDHQRAGTQPVGLKKPNAWGLYDMLGNVMEWCQDCYGDYNYSAGKNPVGPRTGTYRVIRGGGWSSQAMNCRAARRSGEKPGYRSSSVGFRVVRTLP